MAELVVLADDLTGAADTGVQFARGGLLVLVSFAPAPLPAADVAVASTNSRYLDPSSAVFQVGQALKQLRVQGEPRWVYKKVDSTLRGHPAAELGAVLKAWPDEKVLVAPAFPAQGRTVRAGRLYVNGTPLGATEFGGEAAGDDLLGVFGGEAELIDVTTIRRGEAAIGQALALGPLILADAETDADLAALARAALQKGIRLFCGSAGLAAALGSELGIRARGELGNPTLNSSVSSRTSVLTVAGSRSAVTLRQIEHGQADIVRFEAPEKASLVVKALVAILAGGRDVVLTTGPNAWPQGAAAVAAGLGQVAAALVRQHPPGGLVLTGGDTALAVCTALGASSLWIKGEVEPGIPWGRLADGSSQGMPVVSKAGGFGGEAALTAAARYLTDKALNS